MTGSPANLSSLATSAQPGSALIVVTRRIGDVLLATAVIRSLKEAWPDTALDVLVFEGTEGVVTANPDVRRVLTVPERPRFGEHVRLYSRLFRRYGLALSLVPGDRPTLYAFVAGRRRLGLLLDTRKEAWKRCLLDRWVRFDDLDTHTVRMNLALVEALGVTPRTEVVVSWSDSDESRVDELLGARSGRPLAVLHPYPKFNYKMWRGAGWADVARCLADRGYQIVMTGSADPAETSYTATLAADLPAGVANVSGKLTLGGTACLLSRAAIYIGPDTVTTHMSAALGVPTVALFGPSNPVKWGPLPKGHPYDHNPWRRVGSGRVGNVFLVQGPGACVPCLLEGCDRRTESYSDCLLTLPAEGVIAAVDSLLEGPSP